MIIISSPSFAGPYHPAIEYIFPLPDSRAISPQTTIILRFHQEYTELIENLKNIIQVSGNQHGSYNGDIFFSSDNRTIIFKPATSFQKDEQITVTIQTSRFVANDFKSNFYIESNGSNTQMKSIESPAATEVAEEESLVGSSTDVRVIKGVAVPNDFPVITTQVTGETAPGKIFYSTHFINSNGVYAIAVENDGTPYMFKRFKDATILSDFVALPDGNFSIFYYSNVWKQAILSPSMEIIDSYESDRGYNVDEHEFILLDNGHALITLQKTISVDMSQIVSGGRNNANVEGNMFQEFDEDKNVIFEWRSWDHLNLADAVGVNLTARSIDYVHMNAVSLDYDGHYLVSFRHQCEVTKINRNTGETIWRFGGAHNEFTFTNDDKAFSWQHHFRAVPGKPGHYTLFDNGNMRFPNYSRAVEYVLDTTAKTAEKVWEYRYSPDRVCPWMGVVQKLPNGNTFIDGTAANPPVFSIEVDSTGNKVFELTSEGHINYRSFRFDVDVNASKPYLTIDNYGTVLNLIFNKFGDKNVDYYKIFHRIDAASGFTLVDSTKNTWYQYSYYDSTGNTTSAYHDFRITAVGKDGTESDSSNIEQERVIYVSSSGDLILNGNFNSNKHWDLVTENTGNASEVITDDGYTVDITEGGDKLSDIQLMQDSILLIKNMVYTLQFYASAEEERYISIELIKDGLPAANYSKLGFTLLDTERKHYIFTFTMDNPTDPKALLAIDCGLFDSEITIDSISLVMGLIEEVVDTTDTTATEPETQTIPSAPNKLQLGQNYPNPFNQSTTIPYSIERNGLVNLKLYSHTGQVVKILVNQYQTAGTHHLLFDAKPLTAGLYFYQLKTNNKTLIRKLMVTE